MHRRSPHLHWIAAARLGAVCALCFGLFTSTHADPLVLHDGTQRAITSVYTREPVIPESEPLPVDAAPLRQATTGAALTKPESARMAERTLPAPPLDPVMSQRHGAAPIAAPGQAQNTTQGNVNASVHSAIKEGVRPVYDQLVESGAVEALHDLKAGLGLNKPQWNEQEKADPSVAGPARWDAPSGQEPARPPRTAAQAQLDKEMASMMRERLIDRITPWAIGLVLLYIVAYLARLLYRYVRWKSAKRRKRRLARKQRHASGRTRSSSRSTAHTPSASSTPNVTVKSQESV